MNNEYRKFIYSTELDSEELGAWISWGVLSALVEGVIWIMYFLKAYDFHVALCFAAAFPPLLGLFEYLAFRRTKRRLRQKYGIDANQDK